MELIRETRRINKNQITINIPDEFEKFQQLLLNRSPLTSEQLREISLGQDFFGSFLQFQCG